MKIYLFLCLKEDEFKENRFPPYPLPRYLGIVHVKNGENPDDKIIKSIPLGYRLADSDITDAMTKHHDFLIDLTNHNHVTLI